MGDTSLGADARLKDRLTGSVVLRRVNAPLILCDLTDLSETGCRCIAHVKHNDWTAPDTWITLFRVGEIFQAEIVCEPYIPLLCLPVEVQSADTVSAKSFAMNLVFMELDSDLNQVLVEAVTRLDADKTHMEIPEVQAEPFEPKLGEILCRTSAMARGQIAQAVSAARQSGLRLGEYLIREGVVTPLQVLEARSAQTGLAYADFDVSSIPDHLLSILPLEQLKALKCVPVSLDENSIRIACANPISKPELDTLARLSGKQVELVLCQEDLPSKFFDAVENMVIQKRRTHPRFKVSMPATIRCCSADDAKKYGDALPGQVVEISNGGMQLIGPASLGLDSGVIPPERLKLIVTVGTGPTEIVALCEARHIRYTPNDSGGSDCVYGLQLEAIIGKDSEFTRGIMAQAGQSHSEKSGEQDPVAGPNIEGAINESRSGVEKS